MRKIVLCVAAILLLAGAAYAESVAMSSGEQTASALIYNGGCRLTAVEIITDGTNDAKLILYDSTSAANKVVLEMTVVGAGNFGGRYWYYPITLNSGIYASISGTGASYIIEYMTGER